MARIPLRSCRGCPFCNDEKQWCTHPESYGESLYRFPIIPKWCKLRTSPHCEDCGGYADMYMLTDVAWAEVCKEHPDTRYLCLDCAQKRLEAPLRIEDFTDDPLNNAIRFAYCEMSPKGT